MIKSKVNPIVVGIAGGTGAGKTVLANSIAKHLNSGNVVIIRYDSYYKDRSDLPSSEREKLNFDHPDSLETDLLISHLKVLRAGSNIESPIYDFATHCRSNKRTQVIPRKVIIIEGILLLANAELRNLLDIKVFVDVDNDIRFIRRLQRDVAERNRSVDSVVMQYLDTARKMHADFVEPSKKYSDIILSNAMNPKAIQAITYMIEGCIQKR